MPKPYPISVDIDGRTCSGTWELLQGCKVRVRSIWGGATVDAGSEKLTDVARRTLERIVRADAKARADEIERQKRELAKFSRPRGSPHA